MQIFRLILEFIFIGTIAGAFIIMPLKKENAELRAHLADPHHCVSVCVEQFETIGC